MKPETIVSSTSSCFLVLALLSFPAAAQQQPTVNLLFLGDSLTEGVPHANGESGTMPFQVSAQIPGSTYVKLGYRGQTTDYLMTHLDSFLFGLLKTDYQWNILVLWAGTNDCAIEALDCAQPAYTRLAYIARAARAVGWKVIAITTIARGRWFLNDQFRQKFPGNQAALNALILNSTEFDAVADPSKILCDPWDSAYFADGTHLVPRGYQVVADLVAEAARSVH